MLNNETSRKLVEMHLSAMAKAFDRISQDPAAASLSFEEKLGMLVDAEYSTRKNNRIRRLVRKADFSDPEACVEGIEYLPERNLDREQILRLASCLYIQEKHNVIIQGATGSGKSYLANALGIAAARKLYTVKYIRLPDLLSELLLAKANGTFRKIVDYYSKLDLLILDEWLLYPLTEEDSRDLLELVEYRSRNASMLFCSQYSTKGWYDKISGALLADAICDRIIHNSYTVTMGGANSMRKLMHLEEKNL